MKRLLSLLAIAVTLAIAVPLVSAAEPRDQSDYLASSPITADLQPASQAEETEGGLAANFARLLAGLGMFAAVMAIMAAGTETVLESFKVALGMKAKVTTVEALDRLDRLLPGQLAALGASAASQEQISSFTRNMKQTLGPVESLEAAADAIRQGYFRQAYEYMTELIASEESMAQERLSELKEGWRRELRMGMQRLSRQIGLEQDTSDRMWQELDDHVNTFSGETAASFLEGTVNILRGWAPALTDKWLEGQHELLIRKTDSQVSALFDQEMRPILRSLGLESGWLDRTSEQLALTLSLVDTRVVAASRTYIESLRNLLDSVEARRFEMQSPFRKLWRRLRRSWWGTFVVFVAAVLVLTILREAARRATQETYTPDWLASAGLGILIAFITIGIQAVLGYVGYTVTIASGKDQSLVFTSVTPLLWTDVFWNWIRGRETGLTPLSMDERPTISSILDMELNERTVAQVILARTDQQRDEEASRQRWLRVISVFVGMVLAYSLQIDAAELLEPTVPGIARSINAVFNVSGTDLRRILPGLRPWLSPDRAITSGIILTGLAASAGSTFWHGLLQRLQVTRKTAEEASMLLEQAPDVTSTMR